MIIKTLRDAEIALNRMQAEIDALKRRPVGDTTIINQESNAPAQAQPSSTQIINEVDSYLIGSSVFHKLLHRFVTDLQCEGLIASQAGFILANLDNMANNWLMYGAGLPSFGIGGVYGTDAFTITFETASTPAGEKITFRGEFGKSAARVTKIWVEDIDADNVINTQNGIIFADTATPADAWSMTRPLSTSFKLDAVIGSDIFELICNAGATVDVTEIIFRGQLGNNTYRVEKLWVKDLDVSGTVTGISGGAGTIAQANASSNLVVTTSWADVPGASLSLTADGDYLIIATFAITLDANDNQVDGQVVHDDSGSFVALSGNIQYYKSTTDILSNVVEKSWKVTIASQPTTIKLQGRKSGGTGSSAMLITNTSILAIRIS